MCELCTTLGHVCYHHCNKHSLKIERVVDLFIIQEIYFKCVHCEVMLLLNRATLYRSMMR